MIQWFVDWLGRLVQLGIDLAASLIAGILRAPVQGAVRHGLPIVVRRGDAAEVVEVRHRVLRSGRPRATAIFDGDEAPTTRHWVAVQADRVVGVVTVIRAPPPEGSAPHHQLRGMAVLPELQGQGIGGQLLDAATAEVADLWCNARLSVVPFYRDRGWQTVGEVFEIAAIGPHQRMTRTRDRGGGPPSPPATR